MDLAKGILAFLPLGRLLKLTGTTLQHLVEELLENRARLILGEKLAPILARLDGKSTLRPIDRLVWALTMAGEVAEESRSFLPAPFLAARAAVQGDFQLYRLFSSEGSPPDPVHGMTSQNIYIQIWTLAQLPYFDGISEDVYWTAELQKAFLAAIAARNGKLMDLDKYWLGYLLDNPIAFARKGKGLFADLMSSASFLVGVIDRKMGASLDPFAPDRDIEIIIGNRHPSVPLDKYGYWGRLGATGLSPEKKMELAISHVRPNTIVAVLQQYPGEIIFQRAPDLHVRDRHISITLGLVERARECLVILRANPRIRVPAETLGWLCALTGEPVGNTGGYWTSIIMYLTAHPELTAEQFARMTGEFRSSSPILHDPANWFSLARVHKRRFDANSLLYASNMVTAYASGRLVEIMPEIGVPDVRYGLVARRPHDTLVSFQVSEKVFGSGKYYSQSNTRAFLDKLREYGYNNLPAVSNMKFVPELLRIEDFFGRPVEDHDRLVTWGQDQEKLFDRLLQAIS